MCQLPSHKPTDCDQTPKLHDINTGQNGEVKLQILLTLTRSSVINAMLITSNFSVVESELQPMPSIQFRPMPKTKVTILPENRHERQPAYVVKDLLCHNPSTDRKSQPPCIHKSMSPLNKGSDSADDRA